MYCNVIKFTIFSENTNLDQLSYNTNISIAYIFVDIPSTSSRLTRFRYERNGNVLIITEDLTQIFSSEAARRAMFSFLAFCVSPPFNIYLTV